MGGDPVPLKPRVTSPVYCGRCGKRRGLVHTCIVRRPGTRLKAPRVQLATCSRCGQSYTNPLTHVCPSKRGDFKRRKAAADRAARKRKAAEQRERRRAEAARRRAQGGPQRSQQHRYETCNDSNCQRATCRAHKEGYLNGLETGLEKGIEMGHAKGHSEGYKEGYRDGHREGSKEGYRDGLAAASRQR